MEDFDKKEEEKEDKNGEDNRSFSEKLEDNLDEVVGDVQDLLYGNDGTQYNKDIPATFEKDNGIRKVNKVQTRRNIRDRIFGKKGKIIFLVIIGIMMLIGVIVSIFK